jgi:hypothetical protein
VCVIKIEILRVVSSGNGLRNSSIKNAQKLKKWKNTVDNHLTTAYIKGEKVKSMKVERGN